MSFNHQEYMQCQVEEINKYKWIESERCGKDLGDSAVKSWILKYSKAFRENWIKSH